MKKSKKSSAGYKRHKKENGQARSRTEQNRRNDVTDRLSREHEGAASEPVGLRSTTRRKPPRDEDERKRYLWDRKQAELEARRIAAQTRKAEEDHVRKRTTKIVYSLTGTVMAVVVCALAWHFA